MSIKYIKGDATKPISLKEGELKIIVHICNNEKKWGKGFVMAISNRWKWPKQTYMKMKQELGEISHCWVSDDICVINMIAQKGIYAKKYTKKDIKPIRYNALEECLIKTIKYLSKYDRHVSIHMPKIGCGLAGGKWDKVQPIVEKILKGYNIIVYDLK